MSVADTLNELELNIIKDALLRRSLKQRVKYRHFAPVFYGGVELSKSTVIITKLGIIKDCLEDGTLTRTKLYEILNTDDASYYDLGF